MALTLTPESTSAVTSDDAGRHHVPPFAPPLAVAAVIVVLGWRFFFLIWHYSVNVLFWDQWDFMEPFFHRKPGLTELFLLQWGPPREGLGLIADKFLYPMTRWNVRAESFMIGACIFAAMLLALVLKRKLFGPIACSDVAIPFIFLTLAQFETVIGTPNPAYSGFPLLMIMLYCLVLLGRNRLQKYFLVLLLNFFLIYTGFGLFMGLITLGVFALECYWSLRRLAPVPLAQPIAGLLIASASLGSFFVGYTFSPAADCFAVTPHYISLYPVFMARMFSSFVGPRQGIPLVAVPGAVILLAAAVMFGTHLLHLVRHDQPPDAHLVGVILLGYSLIFSANAAVGRVCLGMEAATVSRYMTLLIPAFLAIYFYLLSRSRRTKWGLVLGLFIILLIPRALHKTQPDINWYSEGKRNWAACYVRTDDIQYCDQSSNFKIHPGENDLKQKLDYLKQHQLNLFAESSDK